MSERSNMSVLSAEQRQAHLANSREAFAREEFSGLLGNAIDWKQAR